jgi:hypothetical protein
VDYLEMNVRVVKDGALSFVGFSSCQRIVCCPSDGRGSMDGVHQARYVWSIRYAPAIDKNLRVTPTNRHVRAIISALLLAVVAL